MRRSNPALVYSVAATGKIRLYGQYSTLDMYPEGIYDMDDHFGLLLWNTKTGGRQIKIINKATGSSEVVYEATSKDSGLACITPKHEFTFLSSEGRESRRILQPDNGGAGQQ
jgi:hypothetical protein